jgi:biotin carboxyl carrier protein
LRAPLPGKVVRVSTEPGALVSEGDPLVILSAMKIEIVLRAPHAGRVQAVHCAPEQQVDAGDVLVEVSLEENA